MRGAWPPCGLLRRGNRLQMTSCPPTHSRLSPSTISCLPAQQEAVRRLAGCSACSAMAAGAGCRQAAGLIVRKLGSDVKPAAKQVGGRRCRPPLPALGILLASSRPQHSCSAPLPEGPGRPAAHRAALRAGPARRPGARGRGGRGPCRRRRPRHRAGALSSAAAQSGHHCCPASQPCCKRGEGVEARQRTEGEAGPAAAAQRRQGSVQPAAAIVARQGCLPPGASPQVTLAEGFGRPQSIGAPTVGAETVPRSLLTARATLSRGLALWFKALRREARACPRRSAGPLPPLRSRPLALLARPVTQGARQLAHGAGCAKPHRPAHLGCLLGCLFDLYRCSSCCRCVLRGAPLRSTRCRRGRRCAALRPRRR